MSGTETLPRTNVPVSVSRSSQFPVVALDALIVVALGTVAFVVRWHEPADGLFFDDAWQAFGAWKGSFSEFISVGLSQPGFTLGLMVWTRLFGVGTTALVTPALIAGTLGPPVLYMGLRHFGYARSIALLVSATLVSAQVHITYSYHVKTYTFDVLIVLGLALAVWHLARRRWRAGTAVAWFLGSVVVGSFSSIALVATTVAAAILLLHPSDDRRLRALAGAAQLLVLGALYLASSRTFNANLVHAFFEPRGGYIEADPNPVTFGREVFDHLWNVADVFPGGVPTLALAAGVVGLLAAAWHGPLVVPARFLALMVIVAAGSSLVGLIPFGPPRFLGRVSLWLVPVMAIGLCAALELARHRITGQRTLRAGFDAAVCIAAVLVLISAFGAEHPYPPGGRAAIRQVMASAGPDDAVVITRPTTYSFALYANTPVELRQTPEHQVGFLPRFSDARLHPHDFTTTPEEFEHFVAGADRVHVVHANITTPAYQRYLIRLALQLMGLGFTRESTTTVESGLIDVWRRG